MAEVAQIKVTLINGKERTDLCKTLIEFQLEQKVNQHSKVLLKGELFHEITIAKDAIIEISHVGDGVIFAGMVMNYQITADGGRYTIDLEAVSQTGQLDIELKRRSFQDAKMLYSTFIQNLLDEYDGASFTFDTKLKDKALDGFFLQFDETDWQFLIRMASYLNTVIIPDPTANKPKFHFGFPEVKTNAEVKPQSNYHRKKRGNAYRFHEANGLVALNAESNYDCYNVQVDGDLLQIGAPLKYKGLDYYVNQVVLTKKAAQLIQECLLTTPGGFKQPKRYNDQLAGLTVKAFVKKRRTKEQSKDPKQEAANAVPSLQVELLIDQVYESSRKKASNTNQSKPKTEVYHWFAFASFYAAEGCTGVYTMPEEGERVVLYFPSCDEKDAFITNSLRGKGLTITNPEIKCFETGFGKKLIFNKNTIKIVAKEGTNGGKDLVYIALSDDGSVTVQSDSNVTMEAKTIELNAGDNVNINAAETANLTAPGCSILLNGVAHVKGEIKKSGTGKGKAKTKNASAKSGGQSKVGGAGGAATAGGAKKEQGKKTEKQDEDEELLYLARTIYGESRGENRQSKEAVGWVIRNRVDSSKSTYKQVVTRRKQFSCWNKYDNNYKCIMNPQEPMWSVCKSVAKGVMDGTIKNPVPRIKYYYSPKAMIPPGSRPYWSTHEKEFKLANIPNIVFVKE